MQQIQDGVRWRRIHGSSKDPEERANIGRPFAFDRLEHNFSLMERQWGKGMTDSSSWPLHFPSGALLLVRRVSLGNSSFSFTHGKDIPNVPRIFSVASVPSDTIINERGVCI